MMVPIRNVQIVPVAMNADVDRVTALPHKRGASAFYFIINDGTADHDAEILKKDEIVSFINASGFDNDRFDKETVSADFSDFNDCLRKLAIIMGCERDSTSIYYNMSFDAGLLNAAGLIACSIASRDAVIVSGGELFFMPRYDYSFMDGESMDMLSSCHEMFGKRSFSYKEAFKMLDKFRPDLKGRRTAQYNEIKHFVDGMKAKKYIAITETSRHDEARFSITGQGSIAIEFVECYKRKERNGFKD